MVKKRAVVLGATGMMGQKYVQLLSDHPWFELSAVAASDRNVGKSYAKITHSEGDKELPETIRNLAVVEAAPRALDDPDVVFSALLLKSQDQSRKTSPEQDSPSSQMRRPTEWTHTFDYSIPKSTRTMQNCWTSRRGKRNGTDS